MCSDKFRKIQWKTPALKLLFNNFCFVMPLRHQVLPGPDPVERVSEKIAVMRASGNGSAWY